MQSIFLAHTHKNERRPAGTLGRPVTSFHRQLKAYVTEKLGADVASYFAEPVDCGDDGSVDWFATSDSAFLPLGELTKTERVSVLGVLKDWREQLITLAGTQAENTPEIHAILKEVLNEPSLEDVFVRDDKPVVVNWGYLPAEDFVQIPMQRGRPAATTAEPVNQPLRGPLDTLTWCMIGAVTIAFLAGLARVFWVVGDVSLPEAAALDIGTLEQQQRENGVLRTEIGQLQQDYIDLLLNCAQECRAEDHNALPLPAPGDILPPEPEFEPDADDLDPLIIPDEDTADTAFLEGVWRSFQDTLFLDNDAEDPIIVEYTLDANGNGTREIRVNGGRVCTGAIKAFFNTSRKLIIEDLEPATCNAGPGIADYSVTCDTSQDGRAICTARQNGNNADEPFLVDLRRLK